MLQVGRLASPSHGGLGTSAYRFSIGHIQCGFWALLHPSTWPRARFGNARTSLSQRCQFREIAERSCCDQRTCKCPCHSPIPSPRSSIYLTSSISPSNLHSQGIYVTSEEAKGLKLKFSAGFGIRLEDAVLVTEDDAQVLTGQRARGPYEP